MRVYELLYIISPTVLDQDVDKLVDQVTSYATNLGVAMTKVEKLGRRPFAYEINHHREGTYVLMQFDGQGKEIPELERRLRVTDNILRYLTVCLDADRQRVERMKQKRATRKTSRAQTAAIGGKGPVDAFVEEVSIVEEEEEE